MLDQEIRPMASALNRDGLIQMIENVDEKHQDAHTRLRADFRALEEEVNKGFQSLREGYMTNRAKIDEVEKMPVDAMKLMLTPRIVATIVTTALIIAGGIWASTSGMRSEWSVGLARIEAQREADRRIADMQFNAQKAATDEKFKNLEDSTDRKLKSMEDAIVARLLATRRQ